MAATNYIPTGRTSLVKRGELKLQLQTEYASRPAPRITTTISRDGRVLHKIERELLKTIESIEEQQHIERVIRRQHDDISEIIRNPEFDIKLGKDPDPEQNRRNVAAQQAEEARLTAAREAAEAPYPTARKAAPPAAAIPEEELATPEDLDRALAPDEPDVEPARTDEANWDDIDQAVYAYERLLVTPGVTHVYRLDNQGNFIGHKEDKQFRKKFGFIFKNLHEMMSLFTRLPGHQAEREKGVCEIQMDRLYFASIGTECYFVVVERVDGDADFEKLIRQAILGDANEGRELLRR